MSFDARYVARRLHGLAVLPVTVTPPPPGIQLDRDVPVVVVPVRPR